MPRSSISQEKEEPYDQRKDSRKYLVRNQCISRRSESQWRFYLHQKKINNGTRDCHDDSAAELRRIF